ncbi:hypothetical protein J32TS2_41150 [Shouchella clausii]|jgi:hypothetical protein|uniref:Uncharacterized protein n=1 Tax=Shouchella clausii TaxID=79880 RepID=A0A268NXM5_SHOCL|nr:hypothetical protein [Shouchella clausii]MCM3314211.1 hypothetical protein [Psychrobacillus sp. MER TA 17]SHL96176.1 hypothetical protein SAMN05192535_4140 [Shouchella rhizosphaerae]ALA51998.1 hypothetical protein DB29_01170 [Shouchella clausii]KKI87544.1 hypothetical protein WZ76_04750 [Shouchella clausii]MDO7269789.1 hypothetical protein [Shouchella clausii]
MKLKPFIIFGLVGFIAGVSISLFDPKVFQEYYYGGVIIAYTGMEIFFNIARYGVLGAITALVFVLAYQLKPKANVG